MSDSPRCLKCFDTGKNGQTYKMSGRGLFKCHDCGDIYHHASFEPIEFKWRTDPDEWKVWHKSIKELQRLVEVPLKKSEINGS